ncbi:MAG: hypothetical protein DRG37_03610 [Deltaproteobacteria bacterium]|nr:MAG: hypothetical protein DRG37_03610 [Deltaproteobacteria bacterium]
MKGFLKIGFAVLLVGLLSSFSQAQELKIVYVDGQRIVNESLAGKAAIKKLESLKAAKQAEIDKREKALTRLREKLSATSLAMSDEAKAKQQAEYQRQMKDLNRFIKDAQDDLHAKYQELLEPIRKDLDDIINSYGKEHHLDLILDIRQTGIVYASDRIDITDKILAIYNKMYKQRAGKKKK